MTCTTCHATEANGQIRKQAEQSNQEFCQACHSETFFAGMTDSGVSIGAAGHLGGDQPSLDAVDRYSFQCMTCHADAAPVTDTRAASIGFTLAGAGGANHSIGARYSEFSAKDDYHPESALPAAIMLPEGKVGCVSCHKPYTQNHGEKTVARNLCMQCHNM